MADGGGAGKTRAAAHSQYNVRAVHRTMLGTGGALRRGVGWARFCTPSVAQCTWVPKCRKCEIVQHFCGDEAQENAQESGRETQRSHQHQADEHPPERLALGPNIANRKVSEGHGRTRSGGVGGSRSAEEGGLLLNGLIGNREFAKFRKAICCHTGTQVVLYRMCEVIDGMVLVIDTEQLR